jgi:hypothetical protein
LLHGDTREFLLEIESTRILVVKEDVEEAIPSCLCSRVTLNDGMEKVGGYGTINPL